MNTWQDMDTAPTDGTEILGWREDCGSFVMKSACISDFMSDDDLPDGVTEEDIFEEFWCAADWSGGVRLDGDLMPTKWMPLPEYGKERQ